MQTASTQGDRYAYLEREHWNVAKSLLENELSLSKQCVSAAEVDEIKKTVYCSGKVLMVWKELGATIANHLGYNENKVNAETDSELIYLQGAPKEMGSRFKALYAEHFKLVVKSYLSENESSPSQGICAAPPSKKEHMDEIYGSEQDIHDLGEEDSVSNSRLRYLTPPSLMFKNETAVSSVSPERNLLNASLNVNILPPVQV
jgi:hypothetical protein